VNPATLTRPCYSVNCHAWSFVPVATRLADLRCGRCGEDRFAWGQGPPTSWRNAAGAVLGAALGGLLCGPVGALVGGLLGYLLAGAPGIAALPSEEGSP